MSHLWPYFIAGFFTGAAIYAFIGVIFLLIEKQKRPHRSRDEA